MRHEFLRNVGMDWDYEKGDTNSALGLMKYAAINGKAITGYHGLPCINYEFGDAQFIIHTREQEEDEALAVSGLDIHVPGRTVWDMRCRNIKIDTGHTEDPLSKTVVFTRPEDGTGMIITRVVNADVIPSYLEDDIVKLQVAFFPAWINYYENEEEYDKDMEETPSGKRFGFADGSVFPAGFMKNHQITDDYDEKEKDYSTDEILLIHATVKELTVGEIKLEDEEYRGYIRCKVDTFYGELEVIHGFDQVEEEQREKVKVGSNILAVGVLSGDAAIYEYEKGIVRTHKNALRLLRSVIEEGDAGRLEAVLTENAAYKSDYSNATFNGKEEIIDRFNEVQDATSYKYFSYFATITDVKEGEEELPEPVGTRCLVLATDEADNYDSLVFVKCDKDGNIEYIHISNESRYCFKIDDPLPVRDPFEDCKIPDTYAEAMAVRARYHCFTDKDTEELVVQGSTKDINRYKQNIQVMLENWPENVDRKDEKHIRRMFGYLFAKAMEEAYRKETMKFQSEGTQDVEYQPSEAWEETIHSQYDGVRQERLEFAREYGEQFYTDFLNFYKESDENYEKELEEALVVVQELGAVCAFDYLSVDKEGN